VIENQIVSEKCFLLNTLLQIEV